MDKRSKRLKTLILGAFWCLVVIVYIVRLMNLQLVHGDEYLETATKRSYKTQTTVAVRGEILDSDGEPIVTNRMGLSVTIDMAYISKGQENETCSKLIDILAKNGVEIKDGVPITDSSPYEWEAGKDNAKNKLLKTLKLEDSATPADALTALYKRYGIEEGDAAEMRRLAGFRYEMELRNFAIGTPFTAASDISSETASEIKELRYQMSGVDITVEPIRVIEDGTFAPHVIGRTGLISAEEADSYTERGYPLNATVGKEGAEKAFEDYLRGTEGESLVEVDSTGKVVGVHAGDSSKPGNTVKLTINSKLQRVAQSALENTIKSIRRNAKDGVGEDCNAGSVVVLNPNNGAVYAMASYPSYDLTTYSADFSELISNTANPLLNRAISGTYSPGSTFKPATALAGLENGVITTSEIILDKGIYTYYDDYQPRCWIYNSVTGATHGPCNVEKALQTSCNYYFFEVGRRLGIDRLDDVCQRLGLGEQTGIELPGESSGVLASKHYKETVIGEQWYGGDDLQAAIGQSYNLFTPVQIANYISTIVNGGKRYQVHLLDKILDYNDGAVISEFEPTVLSTVHITEEEQKAIMSGMRSVTEEGGTASRVFAGYPISVGGKTGTASVSKGTATGVFVSFAPYKTPEIVICVLVEHAGSGNGVAPVAKEIMDAYFKLGKYADGYEAPTSSSEPARSSVSSERSNGSNGQEPALPDDNSSETPESSSAESGPADNGDDESSDTPPESEPEPPDSGGGEPAP
ncbi:MAG: penicillin-binding protein 2 [Clostridia bacterium]|nr:penicillin-binding protein 2 [Clostridia bacterium]